MDGWLKGLVAVACLIIIAAGGYYALGEYNRHQANVGAERATRLANVTPEMCQTMATATLPDNPTQPPKTTIYSQELGDCASAGLLGAYERHQLELAGVLPRS